MRRGAGDVKPIHFWVEGLLEAPRVPCLMQRQRNCSRSSGARTAASPWAPSCRNPSAVLFSAPLRIALGFALATAFAWLFLSLWRRERMQPALGYWGLAHCSWAASALLFAVADLLPAS